MTKSKEPSQKKENAKRRGKKDQLENTAVSIASILQKYSKHVQLSILHGYLKVCGMRDDWFGLKTLYKRIYRPLICEEE